MGAVIRDCREVADIPSFLPKKSTGAFIKRLLHKKGVLDIPKLFDKKRDAAILSEITVPGLRMNFETL